MAGWSSRAGFCLHRRQAGGNVQQRWPVPLVTT